MSGKQVPIVFYKKDGDRTVIGSCEVDGTMIHGSITDERFVDLINNLAGGSFFIVPESVQPTTLTIKCRRCKRIMRVFTPTEEERKMYEDEELQKGEAFHHKPCIDCQAVANSPRAY